jgi:DNA-binding MarR family transcriptional regulator
MKHIGKKLTLNLLWILFGQTRHLAMRLRQKELLQYGLTPRQAALLWLIPTLGRRATPAEIARCAGREDHTISSNLNTMERKGMIKRMRDLDRKNMRRIALTKKGEQLAKKALELNSVMKIMSALSEKDRQRLRSILEKMRHAAIDGLGIEVTSPYQLLE